MTALFSNNRIPTFKGNAAGMCAGMLGDDSFPDVPLRDLSCILLSHPTSFTLHRHAPQMRKLHATVKMMKVSEG